MGLWMVVTLAGHLALSIGPLPYDVDECRARAAEKKAEMDRAYVEKDLAHSPQMLIDGRQITMAEAVVSCVLSDKRPAKETP